MPQQADLNDILNGVISGETAAPFDIFARVTTLEDAQGEDVTKDFADATNGTVIGDIILEHIGQTTLYQSKKTVLSVHGNAPVIVETPIPTASDTDDGFMTAEQAALLDQNEADIETLGTEKAPIESPEFTGTPKVPDKTSAAIDDGTLIATEAQVYGGDAALAERINEVSGRGGPLAAHDFGSEEPTQEVLTQYACEAIWGEGGVFTWDAGTPAASTYVADGVTHTASEIFNATWVTNTYNDTNHRFVLANTQDTVPPVFDWEDVGYDTVGIATAALPGLVRSGPSITVDPITGIMSPTDVMGDIPVVSAEPTPTAAKSKLYVFNSTLRIAAFINNAVVRRTLASVAIIPAHTTPIDLAAALGYPNPSANDVTAVCEAISFMIRSGKVGNFALGDWIDLPFLNVGSGYETGGLITLEAAMTVDGVPMTRLIIAGKNFMVGKNGNTRENVAFHTYNVLGTSRMESMETNENGYLGCLMRPYLINNMKAGLAQAGIPMDSDIIYAPSRRVSTGGYPPTRYDTITDKVSLPTEYEMFGANTYSSPTYEDPAYQGRLEYYDSNEKRIKKTQAGTAQIYWEASPYSGNDRDFCAVYSSGAASNYNARNVYGVAPLICIG